MASARHRADRALSPTSNGGYGLTGMRERAELIGGSLEVGPTPTGYRVRLWVPSGPGSTDLPRANLMFRSAPASPTGRVEPNLK